MRSASAVSWPATAPCRAQAPAGAQEALQAGAQDAAAGFAEETIEEQAENAARRGRIARGRDHKKQKQALPQTEAPRSHALLPHSGRLPSMRRQQQQQQQQQR